MAFKHFILVALAAAAHALPNADLGETDSNVLVARACDYGSTAHHCTSATYSGIEAGKYCGFCKQVLGPDYVRGHLYQVNGKSGARSCCDYGKSDACAKRAAEVSG
ncbi:hypothetical protein G7054_g498 [Neopestalotiopsis clavispora]|nr:hypothetical protein G7054_g498 [Neopestalotiopsis clavispora]